MAITYEIKPAFTIPTVDLTGYFKNPESAEADQIVDQIRTACATSGFFQITGHGVPESLQERVFAAAKTLFGLPDDVKRDLMGKPGRGYEQIGVQVLEEGKKPDLKEVRWREGGRATTRPYKMGRWSISRPTRCRVGRLIRL
jgi:isopenicillin N synthase-like dioxygenase